MYQVGEAWYTKAELEDRYFFEDCFSIIIGVYPLMFDYWEDRYILQLPERAASLEEA